MKNKFLLINLNDEKTKKIAEVISSSTSRKILDFLAEKDASESDLSKHLKIPLSTVHYHLQKLKDGGLVVVEEFHYSKKGKEINHYKLANKYIIIAPKETKGLKSKLKSILPIALIIAGISVVIEFVQRSSLSISNSLSFGAEKATQAVASISNSANYGAEKAAETIAEEAFLLADTAAPIVQSTSTLPLWAHIGFWFLLGGLTTILFYMAIEIIRRKK